MIEDMAVRNFAPNTQESYLRQAASSPAILASPRSSWAPEQIRAYQIHSRLH
jgi:hypothetical protein